MCKNAPHHRCEKCFTEVEMSLDNQVAIMHSMKSIKRAARKESLVAFPEEALSGRFGPLANRQRLQIMPTLSGTTDTFSRRSQITGLRGGDLFFYLSQLLACGGMICSAVSGETI